MTDLHLQKPFQCVCGRFTSFVFIGRLIVCFWQVRWIERICFRTHYNQLNIFTRSNFSCLSEQVEFSPAVITTVCDFSLLVSLGSMDFSTALFSLIVRRQFINVWVYSMPMWSRWYGFFALPQSIRVLPTYLITFFVWIVALRTQIMLLTRTLAPL